MAIFKKENFKNSSSLTNIPTSNNALADTLSLNEAAQLLRIYKETLRQKAASGEIPGSTIGRSWFFIKQDLVNHVRSLYSGTASQGAIMRRK